MTNSKERDFLLQVPPFHKYRIEMSENKTSWRVHIGKLDSALERLEQDEPYSLAHMPPPPIGFGGESKKAVEEWRACNPQHPWAQSCALNERKDQLLRAHTLDEYYLRNDESDPFRESRNSAEELHEWAHIAPESLIGLRRERIGPLLLHWDSGVTFEILCTVYKIDAREFLDYIRQLHAYFLQYDLQNGWSFDASRFILEEWGEDVQSKKES
ncbi:MAG: hypothetical protein PF495_20605 [Spirochaetales bacterium]|jgi:hypothetical protein|nr:hypothetical protein [Spirochaetales bacterium]